MTEVPVQKEFYFLSEFRGASRSSAPPYLRMSQAVQVGDVKDPAHSGRVHAPRPSLLETQVGQDLT